MGIIGDLLYAVRCINETQVEEGHAREACERQHIKE